MPETELIAKGNTAEVFTWDTGKVAKLFYEGYPKENAEREFHNANLVHRLGISSPAACELTTIEGRPAIIYEKVSGTDLLHQVFASFGKPETLPPLVEELITQHQQFLSHHSTDCISCKDYLAFFGYPDAASLPDGDFLCHGDFHFGNLLRTTESPSSPITIIDFMNLCHGPKEYDVARSYVLLTEPPPPGLIPDNMLQQVSEAKQELGNRYLAGMGYTLEQLEPFIAAVRYCRERE